ncbi:MAG: DUF3108 domain-containing protein [Gemmatimonadetes bacterium]|nr:DUF3108 domain-containing protein [Gemmatimonadota bacterium]MCB9505013.1 DUF3108 domain-containing protein [Gemmatimonadales bacterium]HPF62284.1 DUF3108 domain-containing protein [Gemmatimonadales bacterium]HRX17590.1 DUF3108 domain-containing protein [Gemmatimonadales bacterium]
MIFTTMLLAMQAAAGPTVAPPFSVGEKLEYRGKLLFITAGTATLEVVGVEEVRGVPSWRFTFETEVSKFGYSNRSVFTSWTGQPDWVSRKFVKDVTENDRNRHEEFLIHPDSGFYRRNNSPQTKPTSASPLDDVAFFYWIRTVPLEVGRTYQYSNYFRAEQNPVIVKVEKREEKEMPDGSKVRTLLLRPIVDEENGMFSKKSKAKLWLTDDARRIPVEIETNLLIGNLKLILTSVTPGRAG